MSGRQGMKWKVSSKTDLGIRLTKLNRQLAYRRWKNMMERCYDSRCAGWDNYGGRGIYVAEVWHEFERYYSDVGDPPQYGLTLDRPDNGADYGPDNWRWATIGEQIANRRPRTLPHANSLSFVYDGDRILTVRDAAIALGIRRDSLKDRLKRLRDKGIFEMTLDSLRIEK